MNGITTKTVYRAIAAGELVAYRFNSRTVRITRSAIEAWLVTCRVRAMSRAGTTGTHGDKSKLIEPERSPRYIAAPATA